jgi:hypothetical protein
MKSQRGVFMGKEQNIDTTIRYIYSLISTNIKIDKLIDKTKRAIK